MRRFEWFLAAFALLMLTIALASFAGDLMPTAYGVLALVIAVALTVVAFFRRLLDDLVGLSTPVPTVETADPPPWKNTRRTTVEWILCTVVVLTAIFAGLSTALVIAVFLACLVVTAAIEMILLARWMRRNPSPRAY